MQYDDTEALANTSVMLHNYIFFLWLEHFKSSLSAILKYILNSIDTKLCIISPELLLLFSHSVMSSSL